MDLPEYLECNQMEESSEVQSQNQTGADASQTVTQYSTNEFEILTESEIEQHNVEHVSETASDVSGIQMGEFFFLIISLFFVILKFRKFEYVQLLFFTSFFLLFFNLIF